MGVNSPNVTIFCFVNWCLDVQLQSFVLLKYAQQSSTSIIQKFHSVELILLSYNHEIYMIYWIYRYRRIG